MGSMLLLISATKLVVDIALFALLGQALVFLFAGSGRSSNLVYQLFEIITKPVFAIVRVVTPKFVGSQFHGLIALLLVFWAWSALIFTKCYVCVTQIGSCERGCFTLLALFGFAPN